MTWAQRAAAILAGIDDATLRADLREQFEERVGICQNDGNLTQDETERIAYEQVRQLAIYPTR
jgi:hypothetical protein